MRYTTPDTAHWFTALKMEQAEITAGLTFKIQNLGGSTMSQFKFWDHDSGDLGIFHH
jgi:hypothetical protein